MDTQTDARNQAEIDGLDMETLERMTRPGTDIVEVPIDKAYYAELKRQASCVPGHYGRLYPDNDTPLAKCPTNLDLSTRRGKALLLACGNPGDLDLLDHVKDSEGRRFIIVEATNFVIFPERRIDPEDGKESTFARTCLIRKDGRIFRTSSAHVPHKIAAALDLYTPEEWAQGIPFRITERKSKNPNRGEYHDIRIEC